MRQLKDKLGAADTKELLRLLTPQHTDTKDTDGSEGAFMKLETALGDAGTKQLLQLVPVLDTQKKLQELLDLLDKLGEYL